MAKRKRAGKISVLAPVGTALSGHKVGDTVVWKVPSGMSKLKIKEMLYQPESAATGINNSSARYDSMEKRMIYLTNYDRKRLDELVANCRLHETSREKQKLLNMLEGRLRRSRVVPWEEIKPTVVTMDSYVRLKKLDDNEKTDYTLVFPEDANLIRNKISIVSHLGISLLGRTVNDVIKTRTYEGIGIQRFVINSILYQPEANVNSRQNV